MSILIRRATPEDGPRVVELVHELATFERLPGPTPEGAKRLLRDAFGERPRFDLFVAQREGRVVAYAVTVEQYSTFRAAPQLYLEDLYVTPTARRNGVARAMMRHLAREAVARGCVRLKWVVLDWNVEAQRFYDGLGAQREKEWVPYALEREGLEKLAAAAPSDLEA